MVKPQNRGVKRWGVEIIDGGSPVFPESLRIIPEPPRLLYGMGDLALLAAPSVAVVGTRHPTSFGRRTAEIYGQWLARRGYVVVSGLAMGCDTAAHEACLKEGGRTLAVLPGGLRNIYPLENRDLARRIVQAGGCLVSEYGPDERPQTYYFIKRDRLQSGLSLGVVVIETDPDGGAMHTARFCLEQKRFLACIEPPKRLAHHPMVQGNWQLIRERKAAPLKNTRDLERLIHA